MQKRKLICILAFSLLVCLPFAFYWAVVYPAPDSPSFYQETSTRTELDSTTFQFGPNWLRKNASGNWESYIEGDAFERGWAMGLLHQELIQHQEEVFVEEIKKMLPNGFLRTVIQAGVTWFNRNLDESVPEEFLQEIYGVSRFFSENYGYIGPKFNRILNYHAAHDIGHMVQNMNLVACSAIAQWDFSGDSPQMLIGRNFDFYFGDGFAENKIVLFINPDQGYDFVSVSWGGFSGVVSGMNEKGLTVTLNALPSEIPKQSETPVSIIAREVVQYASTIEEAFQIIQKYPVFVSESFTIASALDQKAAVIEKTPNSTTIYYPEGNRLVVTNHFQSTEMANSEINLSHLKESESMERFERLNELASRDSILSVAHILSYLREQKGSGEQALGMGNPMAINQLLAHHAVIFDPINLVAYISAAPFQENVFNAYSLLEIKKMGSTNPLKSPEIDSLRLPADSFLFSPDYAQFKEYKALKEELKFGRETEFDEEFFSKMIRSNPEYYEPYKLAGDYFYEKKDWAKAQNYYKQALEKPIPYTSYREEMTERIKSK